MINMTEPNKTNLESEVNNYLREKWIPRRVTNTGGEVLLYVLNNGQVYKGQPPYSWEEKEQIHFKWQDISVVKLGQIEPTEIKKGNKQLQNLVQVDRLERLLPMG